MSQRYSTLHEDNSHPAITRPLDVSEPISRPAGRMSSALVARISTKVQAGLWVLASGLILSKGGVIDASLDPEKSNPLFMYTGFAGVSLFLVLMLYCVVWVRLVMRSTWEWQIVAPGFIEIATIGLVTAYISFSIGLWPSFGLLTPLLVGIIFLGAMMLTHFLPLAAVGL